MSPASGPRPTPPTSTRWSGNSSTPALRCVAGAKPLNWRLRQALAEAERKRAEDAEAAAKRQKQLGKQILIAALVAFLFAIASGVLALLVNNARNQAVANEEEAKAQAKIADSRRLAALSESERDKRLDRSLLLAVEALKVENTLEARESLFRALRARPGLHSFLHTAEGDVHSVAFSPDGKTLAAGYVGGGGGVVLWDVATRKRLLEDPLPVHEGGVDSVAFSPDGKTLAAVYTAAASAVWCCGTWPHANASWRIPSP